MIYDKHINLLEVARHLHGPNQGQLIESIIELFYEVTDEFKSRFSHIDNEKGLTQKIICLLNKKACNNNIGYYFHQEFIEEPNRGGSQQVDIGTVYTQINSSGYADDESFFSIEAKRLNINLPTIRKEEYVVGRDDGKSYVFSGGIERFKMGLHGKNLEQSAILGFIQTNNFEYWKEKVNDIINEQIDNPNIINLEWEEADKISFIRSRNNFALYKSVSNSSYENKNITLHHIWIDLI